MHYVTEGDRVYLSPLPSGGFALLLCLPAEQAIDFETLKIKKLKPEPHETAYSFAETHAKRFHLHIWGYPAGDGIVVGQPDYTQDPIYSFVNKYDGNGNNMHESWIEIDSVNMPCAIIAKGWSGGGDFATTTIKCAKVNEYLGYMPGAYQANPTSGSKAQFNSQYIKPSILARINRFNNLKILDPVDNLLLYQDSQRFFNTEDVKQTVVYWEDKTSRTQDALEASVHRRMSDFMRNAVRLHIKVDDHQQNGNIYRYNTIATVLDEKLGINAPFWIEDCVFRKSTGEGTVTELKLIPLNTLFFGGIATNSAGKSSLRLR